MSDGEHLIRLAKLAEQAERYEDMKNAMVDFVKNHKKNLQTEERNLLSVAFKNVVGLKRSSLKILTSIGEKETSEKKMGMCKSIRSTVMGELESECNQVIKLLDDVLIPHTTEGEAKVFYYKMKGDYLRYLAEADMALGESMDSNNKVTEAKGAYEAAATTADHDLTATHPIRLGLALNYSVFYYEILNQGDKACQIAKEAFDNAIAELDSVPEESYKDSTLIMQLLRDNLTLWTSDETQGQEDDQ